MAGFFRIFAAMGIAGAGWSVGRRMGKKLWKEVEDHYPEMKKTVQEILDVYLEPILKAKKETEQKKPEQQESEQQESEEKEVVEEDGKEDD